ncbi:hypothetical protein [Streptomyces sp. NBC_01304]|uniref:hypothetical protein n=1 Tax=Streptomyces sp. NBC_01304 TaxID=2903818 RepID=UPI002E1061DE|nr:hypothetical protein OG430_08770 [Streptomyces sp. NBC_01304]
MTVNAAGVNADGFTNAGPIQPGTFQWRSQVFDLTEAQRSGTLIYVDGEGQAFRWKMPAKDAGPELARLKAALARLGLRCTRQGGGGLRPGPSERRSA